MPSPVIGSVARAASPTNSTRSVERVQRVFSTRAGMGHALAGASSTESGPSTSTMCGRSSTSRNVRPRSLVGSPGLRRMPMPTLTVPSASGNDHAYPGRRSSSNSTHKSRDVAGGRPRGTDGTRATRRGSPSSSDAPGELAHRRPHAIRADHVIGLETFAALHRDRHAVVGALHVGDRHAFADVGPGGPRQRDQRGVEFGAAHHRGEGAAAPRHREPGRAPRHAAHHDVVDLLPTRQRGRVEPERLEATQRASGEAVTAALVARERWPCRAQRPSAPVARQRDRRGGARRPGADDARSLPDRPQHARARERRSELEDFVEALLQAPTKSSGSGHRGRVAC